MRLAFEWRSRNSEITITITIQAGERGISQVNWRDLVGRYMKGEYRHEGKSCGWGFHDPSRFWAEGGKGGLGDRGRVMKYYYNLIMCRKRVGKWSLLKRNGIIWPWQSSCKWSILSG